MEDFNKLDKHLNKLARENEQAPPAFIWNELDQQLPKKKGRDKGIWFWLFGIGLLLVSAAIFSIGGLDNNIEAVVSKQANISELAQGDLQQKDANNDLNESIITDLPLSGSTASTSPPSTSEEVNEKRLNKIDSDAFQKKAHSLNTNLERTSLTGEKVNGKNILSSSSEEEDSKRTLDKSNDLNSNASAAKLAKEKINSSNPDFESSISPSSVDEDLVEELGSISVAKPILKSIKELAIRNAYLKDGTLACNLPFSELEEISGSKLFIDVNFLTGLHNTTTGNDIIGYRNETESSWYTWGASAQLGYQLKDHVYIKAGIEYLESKDKFNFSKSDVYYSQFMDSSNVQNFRFEKGTYYSKGPITYKQLNIPLSLGAELQKQKLRIGLEATALFNFRFSGEGKYLAGPNKISRVEDDNIYKNNLGLGLRAALMIGLDLGPYSTFYFKPTFSKYLASTNINDNVSSGLQQYFCEVSYRRRF